jgi:plasmid stability protein
MIYFIRSPDGPIKIGTTIRLSQRLTQLANEYGPGLEVLAVCEGDRWIEKELHHRFAELRRVGEWFEPGDDLMGFIVSDGQPWDGSDEVPAPNLTVKLPGDVVLAARIVAAFRGESMADLLGDILRPVLSRMEAEEMAKRAKAKGKSQ